MTYDIEALICIGEVLTRRNSQLDLLVHMFDRRPVTTGMDALCGEIERRYPCAALCQEHADLAAQPYSGTSLPRRSPRNS
jgi:hypothetical protein